MAKRNCGCQVVENGWFKRLFGEPAFDVRCWDYSRDEEFWYPYRDGFERLATARKVAKKTSERECGPPRRRGNHKWWW